MRALFEGNTPLTLAMTNRSPQNAGFGRFFYTLVSHLMEYRVRYSNTVKQMLAFQWAHTVRSPWYYVLFAFWCYMWLSSAHEQWSGWSYTRCTVMYFGIVLTLAIATFLAVTMTPQLIRFLFKGHRASLSPRTMTINEGGVIEETENSRNEHSWSAIQRLIQTNSFAALYTSPWAAHLIPMSAFANRSEWLQFNEFIKQRAANG